MNQLALRTAILLVAASAAWGQPPNDFPNSGSAAVGTQNPGAAYPGFGLPAGTVPSLDIVSTATADATQLRLISVPTTGGHFSSGIVFGASDNVSANSSFNAARIYGVFDGPSFALGRLTFATPTGQGVWADTMSLKNGQVGIGTINPGTGYKLDVAGAIAATDIYVTSGALPDYVFDADYRNAPLPEVAAYIEQNHHLPGMPSAAEASRDRLNVGEMQNKLLEKVEELTLHMIAAEKRSDQLAQTNEQLAERNRELQGQFAELRAQVNAVAAPAKGK